MTCKVRHRELLDQLPRLCLWLVLRFWLVQPLLLLLRWRTYLRTRFRTITIDALDWAMPMQTRRFFFRWLLSFYLLFLHWFHSTSSLHHFLPQIWVVHIKVVVDIVFWVQPGKCEVEGSLSLQFSGRSYWTVFELLQGFFVSVALKLQLYLQFLLELV